MKLTKNQQTLAVIAVVAGLAYIVHRRTSQGKQHKTVSYGARQSVFSQPVYATLHM